MVLGIKPAKSRLVWCFVFFGLMLPLLMLSYDIYTQQLGADPAKEIVKYLGTWAIISLWLSLWVTPLRRRLSLAWLVRFRRMFGLYAFFYSVLHLLAFATFIVGWRFEILLEEFSERPYIIVGAAAVLLLIPLAVTSTKKMQRRLKKRWLQLHKLVYLISILVMVHVIWMVRASYEDAIIYGGFLAVALFERIYFSYKKSKPLKKV
ncbi:sulfite oxidase heme-binding subunit YedZ [Neptunomonas japonica]|uniref:Protein-methionine-sulfoxide reductase heme-binding subunit MsrQ n=1 Tax=Neptunomonas japonica JAMM 1380 TaxID=1441457 RepID=A0A7R6PEW1_9GAMM|nr:protein-methionine-sulfoxide reductase heme-binding subunit MsrQ [Neptunomonas japonica]BBB31269.1 sulfoxide reductase heme-binding subunit YedZ [Neptunomonas japonica JAMM 1380]